MGFFYSASTGGFYLEGIHDHIPDDAVKITETYHMELIEGQSSGKQIVPDAGGFPVLRDQPTPTDEELKEACKQEAKRLIASSDWSMLPDVRIGNFAEFETYRAQLRLLIVNPVAAPIWPVEPQPAWIA